MDANSDKALHVPIIILLLQGFGNERNCSVLHVPACVPCTLANLLLSFLYALFASSMQIAWTASGRIPDGKAKGFSLAKSSGSITGYPGARRLACALSQLMASLWNPACSAEVMELLVRRASPPLS